MFPKTPMAIDTFPLSPNQARYLHAELLTGVSYHLPISFFLHSTVNIGQLQSALLKITQQHTAIRARLVKATNGEYQQYLAEVDEFSISIVEADESIKSDPKSYIEDYCFKVSNLNKQSLMKCLWIKLDNEQSILTISLHHFIADGRTLYLFIDAINRILKEPNSSLTHSDYQQALLAQNDLYKTRVFQAEQFWSEYLAKSTDAKIPSDYSARNIKLNQTYESIKFSPTDTNTLLTLCSNARISIFHVLYAVYVCLLARQTGEAGLLTAFQSHGRQGLNAHRDCLGLFARTLVLHLELSATLSILDLAKIIQRDVSQAIHNQSVSYDAILNFSPYKPRFSINHFPTLPALEINGFSYPAQRIATWHSDFDLNLHIETPIDGLALTLFFDSNLYSSARVFTMLRQMKLGLLQLLTTPEISIKEFAQESNSTYIASPNLSSEQALGPTTEVFGPRIESAFFRLAEIYPERVAIQDELKTWSYSEVALAASNICELLRENGLGPNKRIAILSSQSPLLITSMLAVLRLGAAFSVLDPKLPTARLMQFVQILQPDFIITISQADWLSETGISHIQLTISDIEQAISRKHVTQPFVIADNEAFNSLVPAYFLFSSGTTGDPKCVIHTHKPLIHHIQWQQQAFSLNHETRVTMLSGLMHDPLLRDIFVPLSIGGCVCVASASTFNQACALHAWLQNMKPTVMHTTPSMLVWLNDAAQAAIPISSLAVCFIGGEPLYAKHIEILKAIAPNAQAINVYGTTETPQVMAWHRVNLTDTSLTIPVGQAVPDINIQLFSHLSKQSNLYTLGEIVIKTPYLSAGYLALDSAKIKSGFSDGSYHTGDMGYLNAEGQLVIVGRSDEQIKIRGFRVSLAEIERCLSSHPDVEESTCIFFQEHIVAAVVAKKAGELSETLLQEHLGERLPDYMYVQTIMFLPQLPRLNNHKPDKQSLYPLIKIYTTKQLDNLRLAENDNEIAISEAWGNILGKTFISVDATFVGLGGDSLSFIQASLALERVIGFIPNDWQKFSISHLASMTQAQSPWAYIHPAVLVRAISIVYVLIGHFFDRSLTGGTDALFLIAGYSFAGFQLKTVELKKSVKPIFFTIAAIAIPTLLISLVHFYKIHGIDIPRVFFYGNFILPFNDLHEPQYELFWFIDVLIQLLLVLAALFSFASIRAKAEQRPLRFAIAILVSAIFISVFSAQLWDTTYLLNRVPQAKFWLFALGWAIYFAYKQQQKLLFAVLSLGLPMILDGKISLIMSISAFLLLYVARIKIIRPFHILIYAVASASLMIYLTHFQMNSALEHFGISNNPYASLTAGILGGIVLSKAWQWLTARLKRY